MGFSEELVAKAIEENGEENSNLILEALLQYTASSLASSSNSKLIDHFVGMGFSEEMAIKAIKENGEGNTDTILETLLTYSALENSAPVQHADSDNYSSDYEGSFLDDFTDIDSSSDTEEIMNLDSDEESKLLYLTKMGYSEAEASVAMERCGPDSSIEELTDFICAAQMAKASDALFPVEDRKPFLNDPNYKKRRNSGYDLWKKKKQMKLDKKLLNEDDHAVHLPNPMVGFGVPTEPDLVTQRTLPEDAIGPPYFYYENVALAPVGVWSEMSRYLYDVTPEFVDSKYFCAAARKRGYIHNLPIENRYPLLPFPPRTIHEAFPLTKRWWPSWDPRTKLNCLQTCTASAKLTERIRNALKAYDGEPPLSVQKYVLDECRKWNLVWVGKNKVAPLEPGEVEMLLGFPKDHTRGGGSSRTERYKSLGNSFQVDTVAYHLSVLKDMFPSGITVLSLFSGIGGAEVALHRLGIPLKAVVSVEKSEVNRNIVRSWWEQTNQRGTLIDIPDVQELNGDRLEQLMSRFGGFDLVVGGSPCNNLAGSNRHHRDGLEEYDEKKLEFSSFDIESGRLIECEFKFNQIFVGAFLAMAATATASSAAPRFAPPDPTLPKPWKGLIDGKTGYLYFWNPVTNVTQYERPTNVESVPKSSSVPISSSIQVRQSSEGPNGYNPDKENDPHGRGSNDVSKLEPVSRYNQNAIGGPVHSHNTPNGTYGSVIGGSSARGHGLVTGGSNLSGDAYRRQHEITVTGDEVPLPFSSFEATGFPSEILREVYSAGFSAPTPIQAQSWPIALQGRDIVAIAKTGSGKTLGYLIPGFMHLKQCHKDPRMGPTVLVLSPTRELATQIQDEAIKFGKSSRISSTCLYGGAPKGPQLRDIDRGVDIVVATPGRLNDILEMRRISLHQVSYLVLDEADRMLDMGFEPQIRKIVKEVPTRRQTLMYTATWPKEVRKIAADLLVNPIQVNIGNIDELVANKSITQYVEVLSPMEKHRRLEQILRSQEPGSKIIVFCSTKKMCDQLARNLSRHFGAAAIHGDKSQADRDYVLNQFRTGRSPVLVATDVAARGLDIKDIKVVINYDFPTGVEDYVHRIGRTGRAGATGLAYTFFADQDSKHASDLIKVLEGANQRVPAELRGMASRGGGMGRSRRWAPSSGGFDGGRGGRTDLGFGGRDGGRGGRGISMSSSSWHDRSGGRGYDHESRDRYNRGFHDSHDKGRSRSRSPAERGDRHKNSDRDRSRSRSVDRYDNGYGRSPPRSFHEVMVKRDRSSPPQHRVPQNNNENSRDSFGRSYGDSQHERGRPGYTNGPHICSGDAKEGMIPPDDHRSR
ncbi:hypothetical protein V6N13_085938 [Hibiscus sabdariffa]|uniref:DNA (cytosine-5-)-methyltransferase n=1 Tax=Hibiscus sabdariffa TaxID=183260 RepID=A0ABR2FRR0_9ROSI